LFCDALQVELVDLVDGPSVWMRVFFEFFRGVIEVGEVVGLQVLDEVVNGVVVLLREEGVAVGDGEQFLLLLLGWQVVDGVLPALTFTANPTITDKIFYNEKLNTRDQLSFLHKFINIIIPISSHLLAYTRKKSTEIPLFFKSEKKHKSSHFIFYFNVLLLFNKPTLYND
jgi:hypothetical protein